MVPVGNLSTLSTDAPVGHGNDRQLTVGDTFGEVDPGMDKVLDVETARPLIEALLTRQQIVFMLRFFEDGKPSRTRPFGLARLLSGGASGNRTRHRNRLALRKRRKLSTRNNAKVRETTCGDARGVDGINTASAPLLPTRRVRKACQVGFQ